MPPRPKPRRRISVERADPAASQATAAYIRAVAALRSIPRFLAAAHGMPHLAPPLARPLVAHHRASRERTAPQHCRAKHRETPPDRPHCRFREVQRCLRVVEKRSRAAAPMREQEWASCQAAAEGMEGWFVARAKAKVART